MQKIDPQLREKLLASGGRSVPSDLVTELMNVGNLDGFCASFTITSSVDKYDKDKECTKMKPMTELQIKQIYGDYAPVSDASQGGARLHRTRPEMPG